ncbi:sigma-70 family RNA polymerase sigma factor [Actinomycetospora sp. TBRC 11914]|uniref:sigma-70 family RNA polymerase sigma factor n=1 Tax=Actinomycetospora sp. TBRC 11914 TaxID=2729387 RepID=UPI00145CFEAF|nr:sigma-70 family RNA polymerase sigma factor [Actinomycetospora sp. TBRC 11914]NMO88995.1 sigma-70 family RNA polymerase sigma factor [Actinomycetospora sp. TBRC 11914]
MDPTGALAARFTEHRPHLLSVAQRLLGPTGEADDAVQEAWLRLQRAHASGDPGIENLGGWLTTVVARIALNMLRTRRTHPEDPILDEDPDADEDGPEEQAVAADAVGPALMVVLDTLAPAERLAFVLHDVFGLPFDEIAPIVERSVPATRQLASRARRRVRGGGSTDGGDDAARRREVVGAFLTAAREGDFGALLAVLDPEVVLRADPVAVAMAAANAGRGAPELVPAVGGADAVARVFAGRAQAAAPALLDGEPGLAFAVGGRTVTLFRFTVVDGRVAAIDLVADPEVVAATEVVLT